MRGPTPGSIWSIAKTGPDLFCGQMCFHLNKSKTKGSQDLCTSIKELWVQIYGGIKHVIMVDIV